MLEDSIREGALYKYDLYFPCSAIFSVHDASILVPFLRVLVMATALPSVGSHVFSVRWESTGCFQK